MDENSLNQLKFLLEKGNISIEDVRNELKTMERKEILKQHPSGIWLAKDNRYKTYLPDENLKSGRKLVAKTSKRDIENLIIAYYENHTSNLHSFKTLYFKCLEEKRLLISKSSIERFHSTYKRFYESNEINHKPIDEIDYQYIKLFILRTVKENDMTYKQYCNFTCVLRAVFNYALDCDIIKQNPVIRFHIGRNVLRSPNVKDKTKEVFTIEEKNLLESTILNDFKQNPKNTVPLAILFDFYTGLRSGELASLKWSDIDSDKLSIRRTEVSYTEIDSSGRKGKVIYEVKDSPKTNAGNRDVILVEKALKILHEIKKHNFSHSFNSEYIFIDENGNRIIRKRLDSAIRKYCNMCNITVRSMHKIRKNYISTLKIAGLPDYDIMQQAGHKELTTTLNSYCFSTLDNSKTKEIISSAL